MTDLVCIEKCFHGRLWRPGAKTTDVYLKKLGEPIPEWNFQPVDSLDPEIAGEDFPLDANGNSRVTKEEMRNWLIARGLHPPVKATWDELDAMVKEQQALDHPGAVSQDDFLG